ncbi:DUF3078 domain-containing protein [uncultured Sunxiuqinia sp.]|uniref:DUF3078 domain-containing protein n=1 Tax=uncultured Sunxiuqinia sp. TaxID=1573825 RepID=UPI002AA73822|nr:DUF3078 domain-containing protein [uncultured Sunxiuqinia sp.]
MRSRLILAVTFFLVIFCVVSKAEESPIRNQNNTSIDSVQVSVDYLNHFLYQNKDWIPVDNELGKSLKGLVHFAEDEDIDTILYKLEKYRMVDDPSFFYRPVDRVSDSLEVAGYVSKTELDEKLSRKERSIRSTIVKDEIAVPEEIFEKLDEKVNLLAKDEVDFLLRDSLVILPDSLKGFDVIPDSIISSPADFMRLQKMDSLKRILLEEARIHYNNNMLNFYIDSVSDAYRTQYIQEYVQKEKADLRDLIRAQNRDVLRKYNQAVMKAINDSISKKIDVLTGFAKKDSVNVWVKNSEGDSTRVILRNNANRYTRMFLKNEQKDSLGIRIHNKGKNSMQIFIDDAVTLKRFSTQQTKAFDFDQFEPESSLRSIDQRYKVITPWSLGGDGNFGFSQTALSNWKKGGKSALSTLLVLKGFANYSYKRVKWENSIELRNGWIKPSGMIQKNDDKFEFISRYGLSAFKKWYYSAEIDFQTQLFNGYKYPDRDTKISAFLAPAKTMFKLGLDYKPNKDFSLFLSPFTSKTVYVRDTAEVDPTKFGIDKGKKRYWVPGLNAELSYKTDITPDISYRMKYKMFINYSSPFSKFDVDWENNFVMKLNDFINLRAMLHFVYDDNVKFKVGEKADGSDILEPRWQIKEFITIGFSYKLNKRIFRREKVN